LLGRTGRRSGSPGRALPGGASRGLPASRSVGRRLGSSRSTAGRDLSRDGEDQWGMDGRQGSWPSGGHGGAAARRWHVDPCKSSSVFF
jgi:hypothetical protein